MNTNNKTMSCDQTLKILLTNLCDYCKAKNIFVVSAHSINRNYAVALKKKNNIKHVNIQKLAKRQENKRYVAHPFVNGSILLDDF